MNISEEPIRRCPIMRGPVAPCFSASARNWPLELRRLFGPFVSGLKIPFPGNGDLGSKRLGSAHRRGDEGRRSRLQWRKRNAGSATPSGVRLNTVSRRYRVMRLSRRSPSSRGLDRSRNEESHARPADLAAGTVNPGYCPPWMIFRLHRRSSSRTPRNRGGSRSARLCGRGAARRPAGAVA